MSKDSLYRQEALDARTQKGIGAIALYCPPYRWLYIGMVMVVVLLVVVFFVFGSYTKRETASGALVPTAGILGLMPNETGTVEKIYVKEGQQVKKGDVLVDISPDVSTNLGGTSEMIAQQLALRELQAESDLAGTSMLNEERMKGFVVQEQMLRQQLQQLTTLREHRRRQVELTNQRLNKIMLMRSEGYAANAQVEDAESNVLEANVRLQEINREETDLRQQLVKAQQEIREHPLNSSRYENEVAQRISELKQSIAENESKRLIKLKAPKDSVVATVLADVGQVIGAGQSVVTLLPTGSELQARVMVPSRAVGFIKPGQEVVLRYMAYPYQKFGQQHGRVAAVSYTALTPQEVLALTGKQNIEETQYRVSITLDSQQINVYGRPETLRSGTELDADFLLEKRRLFEWVLEPLYGLGKRYAD